MISPSCDFEDFLRAMNDEDYLDIVYAAVEEATEAERFFYRFRKFHDLRTEHSKKYADMLKDLISYLRYCFKPSGLSQRHAFLCHSICERLDHRRSRD